MPTLPLPTGDTPLDGGDLVVSDSTDVLNAFPKFFRRKSSALVRDGLIAGITQMVLEYQSRASFAAGQCDVLRATGPALDAFGRPVGCFRQSGELDEPYRLRIIGVPNLVTPAAILAAATAILAPFTSILPQYCESIQDRWFVKRVSGPTSWQSYVWRTTTSRAPMYLDRLYPGDAATNGGAFRPQSKPGGARMFRDRLGRLFVLRVPDVTQLDRAGAFVRVRGGTYVNPLTQPGLKRGFFVRQTGSSMPVSNGVFPRANPTTAAVVFQAIVNSINRIKGHSIRWVLRVDPKLTSNT